MPNFNMHILSSLVPTYILLMPNSTMPIPPCLHPTYVALTFTFSPQTHCLWQLRTLVDNESSDNLVSLN